MADPDTNNASAQFANQLIVRATQLQDPGDDILRVITQSAFRLVERIARD